jgi:pyruvate dehydrogenase E1 component alpha subunit
MCVLLQVREVALEAIERARRGDGPTLIEAETYRFRGHSLADPDELRSKEEKAAYAVRGSQQILSCFLLCAVRKPSGGQLV